MEAAQASRVHVMLCVLHGHAEVGAVQNTAEGEGGHKTGNAEAKPKMDPDVAATQVQSMYRGHLVRRQMEHKNRAEEEAAAIKIQAQVVPLPPRPDAPSPRMS